ncbi:hypothetical protein WR25_20631 [Diploscapter pachys]|uniref:Aldehyde dehydrogenase domain-containing protein n=1 Tax=Diploscapter pachys TaxID=2018661 RepID=A0A2A2KZQ9_9BILA|nr:hypothetical protein WR25_20631 [Diploscapter pachys]
MFLQTRNFSNALLPKGPLAYIGGKWTAAASNKVFEVTNPYDGKLITETTNCDVEDAKKAVEAARNAFEKWSLETTAKQRSIILRKWFEILTAKEEELGKLITLEQGKPLVEAKAEIAYSAAFIDWYSGEARRIYGQVVPAPVLNREHYHTREPIGVIGIITPWNFPTAMIARKAGAALAAGCTLVIKPAEDTPLSALAFAQTGEEAGIPPGVVNVIPADRANTAMISKYLCESHDVDAISFTGSTAVGKLLLAQSASTVKRVSLELGGNGPVLVFESADIDTAVKGTMASKFRGSGQTCVSANRVYVQETIHDKFLAGLKKAFANLVVGDGMDPKTTQGPLINQKAIDKIRGLIDDAVKKGAKVELGGKNLGPTGCSFEPTLITGVTNNMEIAHTEIFGPVITIRTFKTEEEALKEANNSRYGLAGYLFSKDMAQCHRVARRMQTGIVGVNEGLLSAAEGIFGGVKESGLGREGGTQGIDEFTHWKYICIQH